MRMIFVVLLALCAQNLLAIGRLEIPKPRSKNVMRGLPKYGQVVRQEFKEIYVNGEHRSNSNEICVLFKNTAHPAKVISQYDEVEPIYLNRKFDARDHIVKYESFNWFNSLRRFYNDGEEKRVKFSVESELKQTFQYIEEAIYCEKTYYLPVFDKEYIQSEGNLPFILGFYKGATEFTTTYYSSHVGAHIDIEPKTKNYGVFKFNVPIFGKGILHEKDIDIVEALYLDNLQKAYKSAEVNDIDFDVEIEKTREKYLTALKKLDEICDEFDNNQPIYLQLKKCI